MKAQIPYLKAKQQADELILLLSPHCERIEIAGSIRRKKEIIGDIEIVAIPKPYETGIFENGLASVVNEWPKVKGELDYNNCKYTQRLLPNGVKLDLFFATPKNYGSILAIRTGSAEYSHKILANGWVKAGYKSEGGLLIRNGITFEIPEEIDLFNRIGIPYIEPEHRNL